MGNPHAVVFVDDLAEAGLDLLDEPAYDEALYPDGVNVEFVVRRGPRPRRDARPRARLRRDPLVRHRRVRGAVADRRRDGPGRWRVDVPGGRSTSRVDVPGGMLTVTWTRSDDRGLTGPAVVVARGRRPTL